MSKTLQGRLMYGSCISNKVLGIGCEQQPCLSMCYIANASLCYYDHLFGIVFTDLMALCLHVRYVTRTNSVNVTATSAGLAEKAAKRLEHPTARETLCSKRARIETYESTCDTTR